MNNNKNKKSVKFQGDILNFYDFIQVFVFTTNHHLKVVIITNWSKNKNLHKMLKIQQIFPKLYRCLLYVVFHNLKPQNAGLVDVKKDLNSKRSKGIFVRENLKNKHSY